MKYVFLIALISLGAFAHEKDEYTLFHPVPKDKLRKFRTERPDKTLTSYTIDAGHWMVESAFFSFTNNTFSQGQEVLQSIVRLGLTRNSEFQMDLNPYQTDRRRYGSDKSWSGNFGNATARYKYNFFGNDEGKSALSIAPFINLPTSKDSNKAALGVALPFDYSLSAAWRVNAMLQLTQVQRNPGPGQFSRYAASTSLSYVPHEKVQIFAELYHSRRDISEKAQITTADFMFQLQLGENWSMDTGTYLGLTKTSDKQVYFIGGSWLF